MRRLLDLVYDAAGYLAAFFVFAIFIVMLGTSALRSFGIPTGGFEEIVGWLTAAAAFTGLAHTFRHGDLVRVELLIGRLPPAGRRAVEIVALSVATVFVLYMTWSTIAYVGDSMRFGDMAGGMVAIPIWIPQSSFVVGTILLSVAFVDELVRVIRGKTPSYVAAVEERHARGDFSEDI